MEVDDGLSSPREGQAEPAPELPLGGHRPEAPHKIHATHKCNHATDNHDHATHNPQPRPRDRNLEHPVTPSAESPHR
ncbi:hypothetical protein GCM10018954_059730 [Kutzneria kofuensis]